MPSFFSKKRNRIPPADLECGELVGVEGGVEVDGITVEAAVTAHEGDGRIGFMELDTRGEDTVGKAIKESHGQRVLILFTDQVEVGVAEAGGGQGLA